MNEDSPILLSKKKELEDLRKFYQWLHTGKRRDPLNINIEFINGRFKTKWGFASLGGPSLSMSNIVVAIVAETEVQIARLVEEIKECEEGS